jgi:hypothetical protein
MVEARLPARPVVFSPSHAASPARTGAPLGRSQRVIGCVSGRASDCANGCASDCASCCASDDWNVLTTTQNCLTASCPGWRDGAVRAGLGVMSRCASAAGYRWSLNHRCSMPVAV